MSHLDQFTFDHFTSQWQVKRLCDVPTHSRALTSIPDESCHFEWSIHDFSDQQESVQSSTFFLDPLQFRLRLNFQSQGKISVYLCLEKSVEKEAKTFVKISILDKDGHNSCSRDRFVKLFEGELEYECVEFDKDSISNALGQDDTLKMCCELKLIGDPTYTSQNVEPIPKILPELNALLTNRQPSDVMLQCSVGNQLHAHRSVLSARSPVFEKMFHHDTSEARLGKVDITDVDMEVCELMLQYIYTGLVQLDQASTLDLMIAADKYGITELKDQCEDWLCTNLSIESVTDCLVWSDQIGATNLKTKCIEYFHGNANELAKSNVLKELRHDLLIELYLSSINQNTKVENISDDLEEEEFDMK